MPDARALTDPGAAPSDAAEDGDTAAFERALAASKAQGFVLCLYVSGITPRSVEAIRNIKEICEAYLAGRYELDVIDIYQQPERASEGQVLAAPTLVRKQPLPLRRLIGTMPVTPETLHRLGLDVAAATDEQP